MFEAFAATATSLAASTAVQGVESATIAGSSAGHSFSVFSMFMQADFVVKSVMLMLLFASFWCWAIIFEKSFLFRNMKSKANRFESEFWSSDALDKFYDKVKKRANHSMAIIFVAAMEEWMRSKAASSTPQQGLKVSMRERVMQVMQVSRNREIEHMESGLGFLATVGSSAPFIGLFGTVWGIMNSFQAIAISKNTSLSAVAPGIAEALLATAIGLFAAIPAVIAYNKFSNELSRFSNKLEDFSTEFDTILSRQLEG